MKRYRYALLALVLVPAIWWAWPSPDRGGREPQGGTENSGHPAGGGSSQAGADDPGDGRPGRVRPKRRESQRVVKTGFSPQVDAILADSQLSNEAAVSRLHALAMDRSLPTEHRLEALTHGMNLDAAAFADLAEAADLPADMASHLLGQIINCNESPQVQIKAYVHLLDHPDPEVSSLASEMLAFQVDDDARELNREQLLARAREKLKALAAESGP